MIRTYRYQGVVERFSADNTLMYLRVEKMLFPMLLPTSSPDDLFLYPMVGDRIEVTGTSDVATHVHLVLSWHALTEPEEVAADRPSWSRRFWWAVWRVLEWLHIPVGGYAPKLLGRAIGSEPVPVTSSPSTTPMETLIGLHQDELAKCQVSEIRMAVHSGEGLNPRSKLMKLRGVRIMREARLRQEVFEELAATCGGVLHIRSEQRMIFLREPLFRSVMYYYNSVPVMDHEIGMYPIKDGEIGLRICASDVDPVTPGVDEALARLDRLLAESVADLRALAVSLGLDPKEV